MTVPATDPPVTTSKYEATVTYRGSQSWTVQFDAVLYLTDDLTKEYSRSMVSVNDFSGTQAECRAFVVGRMKSLIADRALMEKVNPFILKEDDIA